MRAPMNRVDTILASAGTGKTHALVRLMADAIEGGADPASLIGTTFTTKAAVELAQRLGVHLVGRGRVGDAVGMLGGRLGTVNSVCGRIVADFAFELGLSPDVEVIPEGSFATVFAAAADGAIASAGPALHALSESLGLAERGVDWREQVLSLVELARSNGIGPERLADCAARSVDGVLALLPAPDRETAEELDGELARQVDAALARARGVALKATSAGAIETLASANAIVGRGGSLPWSLWAKLSKPKAAKADSTVFEAVAGCAAAHPRHPRLHLELRRFVELAFRCAADSMSAYQAHKAERGLVDFVDQEALALAVLRDPANHERLRQTMAHVFVDEVQDCSPLQLAIFVEMARIAPRSTWVGDPKQSIYGFRGADAALTLAAAREAASDTGGSSEVLSKSWRSRPGLCAMVNDAFAPAFEAMGLPRAGTTFSDAACTDVGMGVPPLSVWHLEGRNKDEAAEAVAGGLADALDGSSSWPVRDGASVRGLRSGDVAVLCRGNDDVASVASALSRRGLPVAVQSGGLFDAPEAQLVASALRWVADRGDRLALVEMARLVGDPELPSAWLEALGSDDPDAALADVVPFADRLDALRAGQAGSTPAEVVDAAILATGIVDAACRWGRADERLQRLEAVRGAAADYELECARLRSPATLAGLNARFAARDLPMPASLDPEAIHVTTYHKSKGLEWPVVVLCQLDKAPSSSPFGVAVECDRQPDWRDPLADRWVRLWPWPYGRQARDVHMDARAAQSDVGLRVAIRAREEAVRLLYVGVTRARDHLVLTNRGAGPPAWLGVLDVGDGPHVSLPPVGGSILETAGQPHAARSRAVAPSEGESGTMLADARPPAAVVGGPARLRPRRLRPSAASGDAPCTVSRTELGPRLALTGSPDMEALGGALHAFLACDRRTDPSPVRSAQAEVILDRWGVAANLRASDAVCASDRLWHFVLSRFPRARVRREAPLHAVLGPLEVVGRVDMLVESEGAFAIVDHKSFPGRSEAWDAVARSHAPQLAHYADAVSSVAGTRCHGLFVHMPILGLMVEVGSVGAAP